MHKNKILRVCHKFLKGEDGYDLDIKDMCIRSSNEFQNYVIFFMDKSLLERYIERNKLIIKNGFYYKEDIDTYIIPIFYSRIYRDYIADLYLIRNILSFIPQFLRIIYKIRPDKYIIHGTLTFQFIISLLISKITFKDNLTIHHNGLINQFTNRNKLRNFLKSFLHNISPLITNEMISVSSHGRNSFIFKNFVKVEIPVPIIDDFGGPYLEQHVKMNKLKNNFKIKEGDKVYCCPGRFSPQKNQLNILKAMDSALCESGNKKIKLIFVGRINDRNYFKKILRFIRESKFRDNYCFIPEVSNIEMHKILKDINILIVPTHNEGLGRVVMEALHFNKMVIGSKNTGHEDIIRKDNGILTDPSEVSLISEAILKISK